MRTIENLGDYMDPLDDIISKEFIPMLFGCPVSPLEREIVALPLKFGGLGLPILKELAIKEYSTSVLVTQHLVETMKSQCNSNTLDDSSQRETLKKILEERITEYKQRQISLLEQCDKKTARILEQASEVGSSNWLSCLPLKKHGFTMNKSEFKDSLCLRYGKDLQRLPANCPCGAVFSVNHGLNCHRGGFIIIRHNEVRDFHANLIKQVINDVEVEPQLQNLDGEQFRLSSTLTGDNAHPDIRARGFWRSGQQAFFDVKIINTNADSYQKITPKKVYERAENAKKAAYNDRILNV